MELPTAAVVGCWVVVIDGIVAAPASPFVVSWLVPINGVVTALAPGGSLLVKVTTYTEPL
jgi:hypothetical protein